MLGIAFCAHLHRRLLPFAADELEEFYGPLPEPPPSKWSALCLGNGGPAILAGEDAAAKAAAQEALALDPDELIAQGNFTLAEMYLGETEAARARFLRFTGETLSNGLLWQDAVLQDFALLRDIGRPHPLMAEIETAFAALDPTP